MGVSGVSAGSALRVIFRRSMASAAASASASASAKPAESKGAPAIGWIGTGVMGVSMASHLLKKGYVVHVNTRTKARAQPLIDAGAKWLDTPQAVAQQSGTTEQHPLPRPASTGRDSPCAVVMLRCGVYNVGVPE
jgi:hypothetical protein